MACDGGAQSATLRLPDGREVSLPVLTDAAGALFLDVRRLQPDTGAHPPCAAARGRGAALTRSRAGVCTYDPGFGSTASCTSAVRRPLRCVMRR